ncbi:MAG: hypothetical protein QXD77_02850 [Candidatus Aenigmatarchaeota archaeon]
MPKKCAECPVASVASDTETKKRNLKAAYDAVVDAQKVLQCVTDKPGNYSPADIKNFYGKAVQGLNTLHDIEECANEYGIPLTDMDISNALERQQEYADKLKRFSDGEDDL